MKKQSILVASLVMGLALPAFAQDGFRVGVQLGSMKTTSNASPLTNDIYSSSGLVLDQVNFKQATQSPLSLDLAWVKGDDEWSLTYFSTKKKVGDTYMAPSGHAATLGSSFITSGSGVSGSRELKATLIDLSWKRTLVKGDKGSFAFSSGLRYSKQSDERSYQQLDPAGNPTTLTGHIKAEGKGFGLTAGLHGRMNFTDSMWLTTGFTAAFINNTDKMDDNALSTSGTPVYSFPTGDVHQSLLQTDAYLRFNMNFVSTFNGYLGYEVRDFNRDAARSANENLYSSAYGLGSTSGFGLAGFSLGLSYTF